MEVRSAFRDRMVLMCMVDRFLMEFWLLMDSLMLESGLLKASHIFFPVAKDFINEERVSNGEDNTAKQR